jgi:hypothetical protein
MVWPTNRLPTGVTGVQFTLAPGGKPLTAQVALAAVLGPLLVQVTVPLAVLPAVGLLGKPDTAAAMSACGVIATGALAELLFGKSSAVALPAVLVMFSEPDAGAGKLEVQVMLLPTARGLGAGLGVQTCTAPGGKPLKAQVGFTAALGPLLAQVPLTLTVWPAVTVAGTVTVACMSARGDTAVAA